MGNRPYARLNVEELAQRIAPSVSPVNLGHLAPTINPGGPMQPAPVSQSATHPGSTGSHNLPFLAEAQISIGRQIGVTAPPAQALRTVIHDAKTLRADTGLTTAQLASILNASNIDWSKEMLVLVSEGLSSHAAWTPRVDITSMEEAHGTLTIDWRLDQPNPDQPMPMFIMLGDPAEVVLTTNTNDPATFDQGPTITLPANDPLAGNGSGTYTVSPLLAAVDPPLLGSHSIPALRVIVADVGNRYDFTGTADLANLSQVSVSGSIYGLGNVVSGNATGTFTLTNTHGSVTISVEGPTQPGMSPLPTSFKYTVSNSTGSYQHLQAEGTLALNLHPGTTTNAGAFTFSIA
jgi:hypothetical protein